jgi:hypothetical protein
MISNYKLCGFVPKKKYIDILVNIVNYGFRYFEMHIKNENLKTR